MHALASGAPAIDVTCAPTRIARLEVGAPLVVRMGAHAGGIERCGTEPSRASPALKGQAVEVCALGHVLPRCRASLGASVGIDPRPDVPGGTPPSAEAIQLLAEEQSDAMMTAPPLAQALRARPIGPVVVNTAVDRPWAQSCCCLVAGHRACVRQPPSAPTRAWRALLTAAEVGALEPARAAQVLVDRAEVQRDDDALQTR